MSEKKIWGHDLPARGRTIACLLESISDVTLPIKQRMGDAELYARMQGCSPDQAWRRAWQARLDLGYGPDAATVWRQITEHEYPTEIPRTAREWLAIAQLDDHGLSTLAEEAPWLASAPPTEPDNTDRDARVHRITTELLASWEGE